MNVNKSKNTLTGVPAKLSNITFAIMILNPNNINVFNVFLKYIAN